MGHRHLHKRCSGCGKWKTVAQFSRSGVRGRDAYCRPCRRTRDRQRGPARSAGLAAKLEADPLYLRRRKLKSLYGLTVEGYDALLERQGGGCAICGGQPERLVVDHNHITGVVRGILCHSCNTRLASIEDEQFMLLGRAYLRDRDGFEFVNDHPPKPPAPVQEKLL